MSQPRGGGYDVRRVRGGFPMNELSAYTAWQDCMLKRPTVRKIVEAEQNVS